VDIISGCFLLIHRALWERLGGFDPAFFMYGEDADLCLRARALGARCIVCPDATLIHHGGASEPVRADKLVRLFRAKAQLMHRHWRALAARAGVFALDSWAISRAIAFACLSLMTSRARPSWRCWSEVARRRAEWRLAESTERPLNLPQQAPA
jgi:GT2 family glycosyltransferase